MKRPIVLIAAMSSLALQGCGPALYAAQFIPTALGAAAGSNISSPECKQAIKDTRGWSSDDRIAYLKKKGCTFR